MYHQLTITIITLLNVQYCMDIMNCKNVSCDEGLSLHEVHTPDLQEQQYLRQKEKETI